jgi:long-subunit acyl-CoA synthetase (AMP-forming)
MRRNAATRRPWCVSTAQRDSLSWKDYAETVRRVARAFLAEGLGESGVVAILSGNRREWLLADLGAMAAGGVPTGIYPTSTAEQTSYILRHSSAVVAWSRTPLSSRRCARPAPSCRACAARCCSTARGSGRRRLVVSWNDFLSRAAPPSGDRRRQGRSPSAPRRAPGRGSPPGPGSATLIYTSGTTGESQGLVMPVAHGNLTFTADRHARRAAWGEFAASVLRLSAAVAHRPSR